MFLLAVNADERLLWLVALGMGLVVVLVVIALLTLLTRMVRDIDIGVDALWTETQRLAQNTGALEELAVTGSALQALRDELIRHDKLLSGAA